MALEVEAKVRVEGFHAVRQALRAARATPTGHWLEENIILKGKSTGGARRARVRLRRDLEGNEIARVLTLKGPKLEGPLKSREELEVDVGDAGVLVEMLERLGYERLLVFEKRRESWRLGAVSVELDELPLIGRFVEVEGRDERAVRRVLALLGLSDERIIRRGYTSMMRRALQRQGRSQRSVRFAQARLAA